MLSQEEMDLAKNKEFTEFSKAVKRELENKYDSNPEVQKYKSEFEEIQRMKDIFSQISKAD